MEEKKLLSDREAVIITYGALLAHGGKATRDELQKVMDWAIEARLDAAALDMALSGRIVVTAKGGEIAYRQTTLEEQGAIIEAGMDAA